jgi:hypothetical protein
MSGTPHGALPFVAEEGDWLKVRDQHAERFWCRVIKPCGGGDGTSLTVVADNDLLRSPVRCGDVLQVDRADVLEVATAADKRRYLDLMTMTGSPATAALLWREERLHMRASDAPPARPAPQQQLLVLPPW